MPVVKTCVSVQEARHLAQILEGQGIEVEVGNEAAVLLNPMLSNAVGGVTLSVAPEDLERSRVILGIDHPAQARRAAEASRGVSRAVWVGAFSFAICFLLNALSGVGGNHDVGSAFILSVLAGLLAAFGWLLLVDR